MSGDNIISSSGVDILLLADSSNEVLLNIFACLDAVSLCKVCKVCSRWYLLANDSLLWKGETNSKSHKVNIRFRTLPMLCKG